jgi:hypothetical protein
MDAAERVKYWLAGEHAYQFGKNKLTHKADPAASIAYIMGTEINNKWHRFQLFNEASKLSREAALCLRASQQLLKACGAARGVLIWGHVSNGYTVEQGSELSFATLSAHSNLWNSGTSLPDTSLLEAPIEEAIAPYTLEPSDMESVFTQLAGLAVVHMLDQQSRGGQLVLPRPGLASGIVEPWHEY